MNGRISVLALIGVGILVCSGSAHLQEFPKPTTEPSQQSAPSAGLSLHEVEKGMPRERALAGLTRRYGLQKVDPADVWLVYAKDSEEKDLVGTVVFLEGKVYGVSEMITRLLRNEGVDMAQALFRTLREFTEAPREKEAELLGVRHATAEITLQEIVGPQLETRTIFLGFGTRSVKIEMNAHSKFAPSAHIEVTRH